MSSRGTRVLISEKAWADSHRGTDFAAEPDVNNGAQSKGTTQPPFGADIVDLVEEMLFQRAACGIRPVLYLSSYIDLECSMLMLLDDAGEARWSAEQTPAEKHVGYHIVTN